MCTKGSALYLWLGSVTRARRGCSALRSGRVLSACPLCVVKVPGADWACRAANANSRRRIFCYSVFAPPPASLVLPCHVSALAPCGALLFLHSHFFLREHRSLAGRVEAASSLLNVQHIGRSPFSAQQAWMLGHDRGFPAHFCLLSLAQWAVSAEIFLADSVATCQALCNFLGFASYHRINKIPTMLVACQEAVLCINLSFGRQAVWQRWLILPQITLPVFK